MVYTATACGDTTWKYDFIDTIVEVLHAFKMERPVLKHGDAITLAQWMPLRM